MRTNTSGLYTASFYKITDLDEGVECFSDLGEVKINYYAVNKECFAGDMDDQNKQIDRMEKLKEEVNKRNILFQPTKFDAQVALKCHLIPFDVGNLKDCLVYNTLDHADNVNYYLNLDLYQALVDKSIDPNSHLANLLNQVEEYKGIYGKYVDKGFKAMELIEDSFMEDEPNTFTDKFHRELLEEVYEALISTEERII